MFWIIIANMRRDMIVDIDVISVGPAQYIITHGNLRLAITIDIPKKFLISCSVVFIDMPLDNMLY